MNVVRFRLITFLSVPLCAFEIQVVIFLRIKIMTSVIKQLLQRVVLQFRSQLTKHRTASSLTDKPRAPHPPSMCSK